MRAVKKKLEKFNLNIYVYSIIFVIYFSHSLLYIYLFKHKLFFYDKNKKIFEFEFIDFGLFVIFDLFIVRKISIFKII